MFTITKIRAILLIKPNFNFNNKLIFGQRMMDLSQKVWFRKKSTARRERRHMTPFSNRYLYMTLRVNYTTLAFLHQSMPPSATT